MNFNPVQKLFLFIEWFTTIPKNNGLHTFFCAVMLIHLDIHHDASICKNVILDVMHLHLQPYKITSTWAIRILHFYITQRRNVKQDEVNTANSAFIFLIILFISQNQWSGWSGRRRWSCLVWSLRER